MGLNDLKVLIAEDEPGFRSSFIEALLKFSGIQIGGFAEDGEQALSMILEEDYDVVFLDIRLPKLSGIELIKKLQGAKQNIPKFVLITAYKEFLQEAFEHGVTDYLVKPFTNERLGKAINRVNEASQEKAEKINPYGLACKVDGNVKIIRYDDIKYLKSRRNHVDIICKTKEIRVLDLLKSIKRRLPDYQFIRIHRQVILNLGFLHSIQQGFYGNYIAILNDPEKSSFNIGRKYLKSVRHKLNFR